MGKRLGNRAIWTSACRIQAVSKVVRPCKRRRNSLTFGGVSRRGYSNETFQWAGRRSHRTSHLSYISQWAAFIWVTKGMQITENPVPRRRPCQKRHLVDVIGDQGNQCWKPHTKESISSSTDTGFYKTGITQCPHCQSSFCQPLRISFQSRFSRFDNISHVMISFSNPGWRHFATTRMRTCLIFGDCTNLLISCCIPAIPRFFLQSDVKDT